jgi:membrane protease YdiL (CAAX protease family)
MNLDRFESQVAIVAGVLIILFAESLLLGQQYLLGTIVYSIILLVTLLYSAYEWQHPQHLLVVLVIPAIIRLLDFTLPLGGLSPMFAQLVLAIPLTLAALAFVWLMDQGRLSLDFRWRRVPVYLLMIAIGCGFGFLLYQFKQPARLTWGSPLILVFYVFILIVAMACLEEWLFRGIMQTALTGLVGRVLSALVVAIVYTILNINQSSGIFLLLVLAFSLGLSWLRNRSESLLNVCLVHGAANIVFFLILPILR